MYTHTDGTTKGTGAIVQPKISAPKIGRSGAPYDYEKGFDITQVIKQDLVTKNQGQADDCGKASSNYFLEVLNCIATGVYTPMSDHYGYTLNYALGGGMSEAEIQNSNCIQGLPPESFFPSYPSPGVLPTEAFMEDGSGITPAITAEAKVKTGPLVYIQFSTLDDLANAIQANNGIIIGIYGENNGTWLSNNPLPPTQINGDWAHWLYCGKTGLYNGQPAIAFKNSWGDVGENGWQWITAAYLPYIWAAFTFQPISVPASKFKFQNNLYYGMTSSDVVQLQLRLGVSPTGFFGALTLGAVIVYQLTHGIYPDLGYVGILTRNSLNS